MKGENKYLNKILKRCKRMHNHLLSRLLHSTFNSIQRSKTTVVMNISTFPFLTWMLSMATED